MNDHTARDGNSRGISDHSMPSLPLLGPRTSCALLGCAVVSMSHWLGATWLSLPWIGLPMGAWLVGAGVGVSHLLESRKRARNAASLLGANEVHAPFSSTSDQGFQRTAAASYEAGRRARIDRFGADERPSGAPARKLRQDVTPLVPPPSDELEKTTSASAASVSLGHGRDAQDDVNAPGQPPSEHAPHDDSCDPEVVHIPGSSDDDVNIGARPMAWSIGAMRFGRRLIDNPAEAMRNARSILAQQTPARTPGLDRLRIGISASAREVDSMMDIASGEPLQGSRIDWLPVEQEKMNSQLLNAHRLDTLVCRKGGRGPGSGELMIVVPEHPTKAAGWMDWSRRMPLSYAGLFPTRVDPACVSCGGLNLLNERDARLATRLAEACAVLGRLEPRLSVSKMWDGRSALSNMNGSGGPIERSMLRLTHALAADWNDRTPALSLAARAGARAASAWLASWDQTDPKQRRGLLEVCSSIIGDEPEASLRLAAGQFAAYEDTAGLDQLCDAFRLVIASQERVVSDPLAFIHAEIELGTHGPLTLGRVAAGLCLLWATSNQQSLDYLRDDLVEDLRYSGRFVGQDQDQLLLREIIRRMDQLRTESLPMRKDKAA
ncbi:MAG: hypothetical protein H7210_11565 [Pyrinomonadaceae bacterium]|nr:hypothetical protein [Phycisphaerales bacterium]